jgi:hypothetical protein
MLPKGEAMRNQAAMDMVLNDPLYITERPAEGVTDPWWNGTEYERFQAHMAAARGLAQQMGDPIQGQRAAARQLGSSPPTQ